MGDAGADRDVSVFQVLLMLEILIGNDQQLKPIGFRAIEQFAVADPLPAHFDRRRYLMMTKRVANLNRNRLIEEDSHVTTSCSIRS